MLERLVRKQRILLQLNQMVILICTAEIKELFFTKKGSKEILRDSLDSLALQRKVLDESNNMLYNALFPLHKRYLCANKDIFAKDLLSELDGKESKYILFLEEKNEDGLYLLCGGADFPIRYTQKMLGKQLLQNFIDALEQNKSDDQHDIQQNIITTCTKLGQLILENIESNTLFNEINAKVIDVTNAGNAGLFLYNGKSQYLVLQEPSFGIPKGKETALYFSLAEKNIIVNVFKNHKSFYSNETSRDPIIQTCFTGFIKADNILVVPLLIGNRCIGVYCILNRPYGFTQGIEMLVKKMMSQIAVLIESAQQIKQLQNHETEMKRIYQQEKEDSSKYKYLMEVHQKLTALLLQESGLKGIVNRIAQSIKMPILLFDYLHDERIHSDIVKGKTDAFQLNVLENYFNNLSKNPDMYAMKLFRETYTNDLYDTVVIAALKVKNDLFGFLVIFEDSRKLSQLQMLALDRAVHMCALEFLKQKMAFEVDKNLKDDFWDALIYWNDNKETDIVKMAVNFGFDFSRPYVVALLCFNSVKSLEEDQTFLQEKKQIQRVLSEILKKIQGGLLFSKADSFIILTPCSNESDFSYKGKNLLFTQLERAVFDTLDDNYYIGIGSVVTELKAIKQSYHEARTAVDFLKHTGKKGLMFFHEMGFYQLFTDQQECKHMEGIAKKQLKELIESDRSKGTSYLKTLEKYFYHDGNLRETSDDLHIHLNTLRYRLKILKDTFNIDLTIEKCKFDTYFSVKTLLFLCPELFESG